MNWRRTIGGVLAVGTVGGAALAAELNLHSDAQGRLQVTVDGRDVGDPARPGGLFAADLTTPATAVVELIADGDLEGDLRNWHIGNDWQLDETVAASGRRSLRIDWPEAGRSDGAGIRVPVRPNQPYRARVRIKGAGATPFFAIKQLDASGQAPADYSYMTMGNDKPNSDWFEVSYDVLTQPFCHELDLYVEMWEKGLPGTAWVDDFSLVELSDDYLTPQRPVVGDCADGVLRAEAPEGMTMQALFLDRGDYWELKVSVENPRGDQRAASVSVRLPLDPKRDWRFYQSLNQERKPVPGQLSGSTRLYGDRRVVTALPLAAVGDGEVGVALAIPMDEPRIVQLGYDPELGLLAQYEFGFAPEAGAYANRADFSLYLYAFDPRAQFRGALQSYYDRFPQFFERRLDVDGTAAFTRGEHQNSWGAEVANVADPRYYVPSLAIWNNAVRPEELAANRRELIRNFAYTETTGWWGWALGFDVESAKAFQPSPSEVLPMVEKLAAEHPEAGVRDRARSVIESGMWTVDGLPLLGAFIPEYCGYHYECNPDWELPGTTRYSITRAEEIQPAFDLELDGVYFDCIFTAILDNYRREHFQYTIAPLGFDHTTRTPGLPLPYSVFKCVRQVASEMRAAGKYVIANFTVTDWPVELFCIPFIDVVGNEMLGTYPNVEKMRILRILARTKPVSLSWMEAKNHWPPEKLEAELLRAMSFGFFYHVDLLPRELVRKYTPVTRRLSSAGWSPLPEAELQSEVPVDLERFGALATGDLHYTLYNDTDTAARLKLTLPELPAGSAVYLVPDAYGFEPLNHPVELHLAPRQLAVVTVATPARLRRDLLADVPGFLQRAANYLAVLPPLANAPDWAALQRAVAEEHPDYEALLAGLQPLTAAELTGEEALYLGRVNDYLAWARRQIAAAQRWEKDNE